MKPLLVALFIGCYFITAAQPAIDEHFKLYDTRSRQLASVNSIISVMKQADVLFFGEEHNDSVAHYLEHTIFQALALQYPGEVALSLEMFETDNQVALDEYLHGFIDESRLAKDTRLWSNYKDYRPMIELAKQNRIPVIAANPPRRYVNLVSRRGMKSLDSLDKRSKSFLPSLPYDTLIGRYREKFMDIMKGSPGAASANIYYSQSLWDAGMANSIYQYLRKNKHQKVFHCVGKFHVEEKLGTARQLQNMNKKLRILNIICISDSSFNKSMLDETDWQKFQPLGDYIIITNPELRKTY